MHRAFIAIAPVFFSLACASQSPDVSVASTGSAASTTSPALEALKRGGTFMFSLDESDPATTIRQQCAAKSGGDQAKADACYAEVRAIGSREGFRFTVGQDGQIVWTSFGSETPGNEIVFLEAPLSVTAEGDRVLVMTLTAAPHGTQAKGAQDWRGKAVRFELADDTLVMSDPRKGKLVFHRAK